MNCFSDYITSENSVASKSGMYFTDLAGCTISLLDDLTKEDQEDYNECFEYLYKAAQRNLKVDVQKKLANRFHIDKKLITRETSEYKDDINTEADLAGVKIEVTLPKYARLIVNTVEIDIENTWSTISPPLNLTFLGVTYGNGIYVAVESNGRVITSPDGVTWTLRVANTNGGFGGITFGNDLFVAIGSAEPGSGDNVIMTSPDGITWTPRTSPNEEGYRDVTFGDDLFVAVGTDRIATSSDGVTWTARTSPAANAWNSVIYGAGLYVAVSISGTGNRAMVSDDGITWVVGVSAADNNWNDVTFGEGLFVAVASTGSTDRIMTSPDGLTWALITTENLGLGCITYGDGLFIALGGSLTDNLRMTSEDGITWETEEIPENGWTDIVFAEGLFVVVAGTGSNDRILISQKLVNIYFYDEDEDGELLHTVSEWISDSGKNTIEVFTDFEVDELFVAFDPTDVELTETRNKYYPLDSGINNSADLRCHFPCWYGGEGTVTQINQGGLNVKFLLYCSIEKVLCDNLPLFDGALLYKLGIETMKERITSQKVNRTTVLTTERATELLKVFTDDYMEALEAATMNLKMTEDPICFSCKRTVSSRVALP